MINLTKGNTEEAIVVTVTENTTGVVNPQYTFVFTHTTTKQEVPWTAGANESDYPERFDHFFINTDTVFSEYPTGMYTYVVYEDLTTVVERGKMILHPAEEFERVTYSTTTTYKAYNG